MPHNQTIETSPVKTSLPANLNIDSDVGKTWSDSQIETLFSLPFNELMFQAQEVHRAHFPNGDVELATLISIKTGGCPEDCGYCPQAARHETEVKASKLLDVEDVLRKVKLSETLNPCARGFRALKIMPKD